jgi:hypothetical protein
MICNTHCPYCGVELVRAENLPRSRSREHMIPNTCLARSRSRGEADFYSCRECNCAKSKIDFVLSAVAKVQSADSSLAARALSEVIRRNDKAVRPFHRMMGTAEHHTDGFHFAIPIDGQDLYEYLCFLGKGQHFRSTGTIFDPRSRVIQVEFINKQVTTCLEQNYENDHRADPFGDLERNPHAESIGGGECLIWSKGDEHLFLFHHYTVAIVCLPVLTEESSNRARELHAVLLRDFPTIRPTGAGTYSL